MAFAGNACEAGKCISGGDCGEDCVAWEEKIGTYETANTFALTRLDGTRACPQDGGKYEAKESANHGDMCRNGAKEWDCPSGCSEVRRRWPTSATFSRILSFFVR